MNRTRRRPPLAALCRRPLAAALLAIATGATALSPGEAAAQGDPVQKVKELHKKGQKAYDAGNMQAAYEAYVAAFKLQKSYDIAANLASVELDTARFRDAAEHIAFALANLPISGSADKRRAALTGMLERARKEIGVLTVRVSPESAPVTLDGITLAAPLPEVIYVDPGEHTLRATAPGLDPAEQKVRIDKGGTSLVMLAPSRRVEAPPPPPPAPGLRPEVIGGLAVAGAGVLAGAAFAVLSTVKAGDAAGQYDALLAKSGPAACAGASPGAACASLHDARRARDTWANTSFWTFAGAGTLAAGTVVYMLVRRAPAKALVGVSASPVVRSDGGGFTLRGSF